MKVMIVVTHLLGTGHLARALTLAKAFGAEGDDVVVVSGGQPVPHLDDGGVVLVQLPPVRSDGVNFSQLLTTTGDLVPEDLLAERQSLLLSTLAQTQPDVLITELFPFGRRILKREFATLLDAAHAMKQRPLICASVRDILAPPSKPTKADATHTIIANKYDCVLVHSDASVMPLDLSWPVTDELRTKLIYTGFVAPPAPVPQLQYMAQNEIIVSAGGGGVGRPLFNCVLETAKLMPDKKFRLLVGGGNSGKTISALSAVSPPNAKVEAARPDFREILCHAAASVSLCGYNTALDILQTGCPAVFLPFDDGNEVEQTIRANALARQKGIEVVETAKLSPPVLKRAIERAMTDAARAPLNAGVDGAQETVRILHMRVSEKL